MSIIVSEEVLERAVYSLAIKLSISSPTNYYSSQNITPKIGFSSKIGIDDKIDFQAMFFEINQGRIQSFVKFTIKDTNDKNTYKIRYKHTENDTNIIKKHFSIDDSWQSVANFVIPATYIVKLTIKIAPRMTSYSVLYEDTDLTDFQLRGTDGSVYMHKAVAAACSPFFKTLFAGTWRETANGIVDIPDTSVETLKQLKDYLYLSKLPESGDVTKLLLLSSCYMMPDLETRCVYELCKHVTTDTAYELLQFAVKNNMSQLLYELLLLVQQGKLDVNDMKNLYNLS